MRISDWSSDVCSSDLFPGTQIAATPHHHRVFIARCEQKMLPEGFGIGLSGIAVKIRLEQGSDAPQTARTSPQVGLPEGFRYGGNLVQRYRSPICNVTRGESGFRSVLGSVLNAAEFSMLSHNWDAAR